MYRITLPYSTLGALYNSTNAHRQLGYMKEARRLSLKRSTPVPIFPYTQYLYERSQLFLNMVSVVNVYHTKTTFNTYLFTLKIPQICFITLMYLLLKN